MCKLAVDQYEACAKMTTLMREYFPIIDALPYHVILTKYEEMKVGKKDERSVRDVSAKWFGQLKTPFPSLAELTSSVHEVCDGGRNDASGEEGDPQGARATEYIGAIGWDKDSRAGTKNVFAGWAFSSG